MITNERQYKITKRKERSFHEAIGRFDAQGSETSDVHPRIRQAEREAMESQLDDLRAELAEYDRLKAADLSVITTASVEAHDAFKAWAAAERQDQRHVADTQDLQRSAFPRALHSG